MDVLNKLRKLNDVYRPTAAVFEVTNRCNASCTYCYLDEKNRIKDLSTDQCMHIIDKLYEAGVLLITLTGGEPFLRDDFLQIVDRCIKRDFFGISILTNGTALNEHHLQYLIKNARYLSRLRMSVFSTNSGVHDGYLGVSGALDRVLESGKRLLDHKIPVEIALNTTDFNVDSITLIKKELKEMGFAVSVGLTKLTGSENGNRNEVAKMSGLEFYKRFLRQCDGDIIEGYTQQFCPDSEDSAKAHSNALCRGLKTGVSIDARGLIRPCITFRKLHVGSMFDSRPLPEILKNSDLYNKIRSMTKSDLACASCEHHDLCSPCLGAIHSDSESFRAKHTPTCDLARAVIDFKKNNHQ